MSITTTLILLVLAVMNVLSFALMGIDKHKARRGQWRIPEKTLFLTTALFGGLGGVMGMQVFRHKTKHLSFRIGYPVLLIIQIVLLAVFVLR